MNVRSVAVAASIVSLVACASTTATRRADEGADDQAMQASSSEADGGTQARATSTPPEDGFRAMTSSGDFETTVDAARAAIESRGLGLMAQIDHGANAEGVGLELRPTTLFLFGNPEVGSRLMAARQTVGIDLPLKLLVWQDAEGAVHVAYQDPAWIAQRHDVRDMDDIIEKMRGALDGIASEAASR
jgi:uncharacterized protein (DUF302 family)